MYTAFGLQCKAKEEKHLTAEILAKDPNSLDSWYNNFSSNARVEDGSFVKDELINHPETGFCSQYRCESPTTKNTPSCLKGGPVSYLDLAQEYKCGNPDSIDFAQTPRDNKCTETALQNIGYLKSLKEIQAMASVEDSSSETTTGGPSGGNKKPRLPNFAENFVGVKRTLETLNLEVNPTTIAAKAEDFKEKNLDPSVVPYTPNQNKSAKSSDNSAAKSPREITPGNSMTPTYNPTRAISSPVSANSSKKIEAKEHSMFGKASEDNLSKEDLKTRKQLEDLINQLKKDKVQAKQEIIKNEEKISKSISSNSVPSKADLAERERLRNWANDLDDRERRLNQEQRNLDEKIASYNAPAASAVQNPSASGTDKTISEQAKNLMSTTKGEQKANTAAMIQSDKETREITTNELKSLTPDKLKELGINTKLPFTLRVNFENKIHEVIVNNIPDNGKTILAPVLDSKEKNLREFLLNTELFKPYLEYRKRNESISKTFESIIHKK